MTSSPLDPISPRVDEARHLIEEWFSREGALDLQGLEALIAVRPDLAAELAAAFDDLTQATEIIDGLRGREVPSSSALDLETGFCIGDYELISPLGTGSQGVVWKARDHSLDRRVALKLLPPEKVDERSVRRLIKEARAGGRLRHPGIVATYQSGESGGFHWIAQELVDGPGTLADRIGELQGRIEDPSSHYRWAATMVMDVARALQVAHEAGIVHRDVKPRNILLDHRGKARVADFGLSRVETDHPSTRSGSTVGTFWYMSPEQIDGSGPANERSDIFSLGIVLYELLALRRPFDGDTTGQVAQQILRTAPIDLRSLRSRVPRDLATICGKCLEKDPGRRYSSMSELAQDLERFLEGHPISARPPSVTRRAVMWAARNPGVTAALMTGAAALVVTTALLGRLLESNRSLREESDRVRWLSTRRNLEQLVQRADGLWPPYPENIPAYVSWITDAREQLTAIPEYRAQIESIASIAGLNAPPSAADPTGPLYRREAMQQSEARWWIEQIEALVGDLEQLQAGLLADDSASPEYGWSVPRRLAFARYLEQDFGEGGRHAAAWRPVLDELGNDKEYGIRAPLTGIVPIGLDPHSGLYEFVHLMSGAVPVRDKDGELVMTQDTGIILVLLPDSRFWMGAERDEAAENHDPMASPDEAPVREVELSAHLISKYELTQGQWKRLTGANPSRYGPDATWSPGYTVGRQPPSLLLPVEGISWLDAHRQLTRAGLRIPSEAQWEHACRAGTSWPWWTGVDRESLRGAANLADIYAMRHGGGNGDEWLDDGATVHAPVGTYRANAFGLHDTLGNVWEWCLDGFNADAYLKLDGPDPVWSWDEGSNHSARGGSYQYGYTAARTACRIHGPADHAANDLGVRPAMGIE